MPRGSQTDGVAIDKDVFAHLVDRVGGVRTAARALGCDAASISRYCSGQRYPSPATIAALTGAGRAGTVEELVTVCT
jgi:hypothetical protein